jgi:hypothetical protein
MDPTILLSAELQGFAWLLIYNTVRSKIFKQVRLMLLPGKDKYAKI